MEVALTLHFKDLRNHQNVNAIALSTIHPIKADRTPHTLAKNCHYHKKLIVS